MNANARKAKKRRQSLQWKEVAATYLCKFKRRTLRISFHLEGKVYGSQIPCVQLELLTACGWKVLHRLSYVAPPHGQGASEGVEALKEYAVELYC